MDYTLNIVSKCRFFFIFKHSRAPKRSWKKFSWGPGKSWKSPGFFVSKRVGTLGWGRVHWEMIGERRLVTSAAECELRAWLTRRCHQIMHLYVCVCMSVCLCVYLSLRISLHFAIHSDSWSDGQQLPIN